VKKKSLRILLAMTIVMVVAMFTSLAQACLDAKFIWDPYNYPPVFSVGDAVTFNASISTLNWNSTTEEYVPLVSVKWDFGDGTTEDYYGHATLSGPQWVWTFEGGNISEGMVVTHVFTQPGTYNVNLTIIDANGESKWWALSFVIEEGSTVNQGFPLWIPVVVVVVVGIGIAALFYFTKIRKPT
jgi:hypothetical protein